MRNIIVFLLVLGILFIVGRMLKKTASPVITADMVSHAYIVDVRQPEEFAAGHFAGAVNVPLGDISGRVSELKAQKKTIIVYCRSGNRSGQAKAVLAKYGLSVLNGMTQKTLESAK